ncbi:indole-3-glycerol phosphate synthase TrpC [Rubinisphaera margarita]|uniref:indole-3-glycerol phosphate synthase TrpC n=1 Tax=Rubinisphaera margarita TaxID=2909586 RepID=UPI001EE97A46|nr:indole-3-glycerol phosphate synthase TrpC [Rubinisphaera margarita]MCG6157609.1 indole-3-glycerol phosphate synthase TrpC [Rubinisphaera margarita]
MRDILQDIVAHKRGEIAAAKERVSFEDLVAHLPEAPPVKDFVTQLRLNHPMGVIAEVKKASPSAGIIREDFDPVAIAKTYAAHGASCISVLTDENFFQGHLDYLKQIRQAVDLPLLRKDFILDRYQIAEARVAGADCVLLIAECLTEPELRDLYQYSRKLGMQALVELYDVENMPMVLDLNPHIIGVNNRNLRTFKTDLGHSIELRKQVRDTILFVSESGIRTREHTRLLEENGIHAILVGESLMRSDDIGAALQSLLHE